MVFIVLTHKLREKKSFSLLQKLRFPFRTLRLFKRESFDPFSLLYKLCSTNKSIYTFTAYKYGPNFELTELLYEEPNLYYTCTF